MKHKVLLLGLGFWANHWLQVIQEMDKVDLVGIAASMPSIDKACLRFGLSKDIAYTDYKVAIENVDADIMIIVLPAELHADAAERGMNKGMHIIMEKPIAANMAEAEQLLEHKKKYPHIKFMTSQNYRWRQHNQTIKKAIGDGMIGKISSISVEFRKQEDLQGYRKFLDMPLLRDCAIHHFDLIRFFTGENCDEIYCQTYRPYWSKFDGKPNTNAILTLTNGIKVIYNGTWAARGKETSWDGNFVINGDKGCLTLDELNTVRFYPFIEEDVNFDAKLDKGIILNQKHMDTQEMKYGLDQFITSIEKDIDPETTLEDNIKSFAIVCKAIESVKLNKSIKID